MCTHACMQQRPSQIESLCLCLYITSSSPKEKSYPCFFFFFFFVLIFELLREERASGLLLDGLLHCQTRVCVCVCAVCPSSSTFGFNKSKAFQWASWPLCVCCCVLRFFFFLSFIKCPETFSFLQLRWDCGPQPKWECVGDTLEISYIASSSSSSSPLPSRLFYSFFSSFLSATSLPKLSPSSKEQQITGLLPLPLVYLFIDMTRAYASQMRERAIEL